MVDAAMNDLLRPALYRRLAGDRAGASRATGAVAATTTWSARFARPAIFSARDGRSASRAGDLLAVRSAGAYGFSMSSNYNSRPRAAEVLVDGERAYVIRQREQFEDLIRGEQIPDLS